MKKTYRMTWFIDTRVIRKCDIAVEVKYTIFGKMREAHSSIASSMHQDTIWVNRQSLDK